MKCQNQQYHEENGANLIMAIMNNENGVSMATHGIWRGGMAIINGEIIWQYP